MSSDEDDVVEDFQVPVYVPQINDDEADEEMIEPFEVNGHLFFCRLFLKLIIKNKMISLSLALLIMVLGLFALNFDINNMILFGEDLKNIQFSPLDYYNPDELSLLQEFLKWNPSKRISASRAKLHKYFSTSYNPESM